MKVKVKEKAIPTQEPDAKQLKGRRTHAEELAAVQTAKYLIHAGNTNKAVSESCGLGRVSVWRIRRRMEEAGEIEAIPGNRRRKKGAQEVEKVQVEAITESALPLTPTISGQYLGNKTRALISSLLDLTQSQITSMSPFQRAATASKLHPVARLELGESTENHAHSVALADLVRKASRRAIS